MAIRESIEISRSPEDVFAYLDDLATHGEWQEQVVSAKVDGGDPTRVGTRSTETRKIGGREQQMTYEVTEHNPPQVFAFRGVDGSVRAIGRATIEPLDGGARSRVTLDLDFDGHGMGKLLPKDQARLKERLESGTPAAQGVTGRSRWCSLRFAVAPRGRGRARPGDRGSRRRSWGRPSFRPRGGSPPSAATTSCPGRTGCPTSSRGCW